MNRYKSWLSCHKTAAIVLLLCVIGTVLLLVSALSPASPNAEASNGVLSGAQSESAEVLKDETIHGYALYIDGHFICASSSGEELNNALNTLCDRKASSVCAYDIKVKQLLNDINIIESDYPAEYFVNDENKLLKLLGIQSDYAATFILSDVFGKPVDTNITVTVSASYNVVEEVLFDTEKLYTDSKSDGYKEVISSGSNGTQLSTYDCVLVDDEIIMTSLSSHRFINEPVDEVVLVGIRKPTTTTVASFEGIMCLPYNNGRISSGYGYRSGEFHKGIDIIAKSGSCYGDDIYAAADGVVLFAGESSSYGKYIKIQHDNHLVTIYAHMSELWVSTGDTVSQGQKIGEVGSTGNSTGPHLHFEVRVDGTPENPLGFVTYPFA